MDRFEWKKGLWDYLEQGEQQKKRKHDFTCPNLEKVWEQENSYISPIQFSTEAISREVDENTYKVVTKLGINVNKQELIKALDYDRKQYEKGYHDAKDRYYREAEWIVEDPFTCRCSKCNRRVKKEPAWGDKSVLIAYPYCSGCGSTMRLKEK